MSDFLQGSDYAVGPTSDDRPFFFDLNLGLPDGLGAALWYAGVWSPACWPWSFSCATAPTRRPTAWPGRRRRFPAAIWSWGCYMALLGFGFMCVEVPVIQRFILVLGEPVLALTVVLTTLLVAGGAGARWARASSPGPPPLR